MSRTGYPSLDAMLEAIELGRKIQQEFLLYCKGQRTDITAKLLLEDIPSVVSPVVEQRWLEENKNLDMLESLLNKSIELEKQVPGPNQNYNIANAYNKLGYHYRFRRDWPTAISSLNKALSLFSELYSMNPDNSDIPREIGTAYFHLGEVNMAKWRLGGSVQDLEEARNYFKRAIEIDEISGNDSSLPRNRLRVLP